MPTPRYRIPNDRLKAFFKLVELNDNSYQELMASFSNSTPLYKPDKLISKLVAETSSISRDDAEDIIATVMPLYRLQIESTLSIPDFVDEFCKSIEQSAVDKKVIDGQLNDLKKRLIEILNVKSIAIASRAIEIISEHEHVFSDSRVFTDVRPIFTQNPQDTPEVTVIIHNLKISYFDDKKNKEFFIALDSTDLQKLIDVLERSKTEAESVRAFLKKANLTQIHAE